MGIFCKTKKLPHYLRQFQYDLIGNRTRVYAVRGRRLNRLTMRPYLSLSYNTTGFSKMQAFFEKNSKKLKKLCRLLRICFRGCVYPSAKGPSNWGIEPVFHRSIGLRLAV